MNQEEQIIRTEYSELMQKSYIDYAMSVLRCTGFKPSLTSGSARAMITLMA